MPAPKKLDYVAKLKERLKPGKAFYFTDFTGLAVKNLEVLRRELRKNNASYVVLRNTLGYITMKDLGFEEKSIRELFVGPTGIAIAFDDPVVLAKILNNIENLRVKGGIIEGQFVDKAGVVELAKIPSKEILYSHLVGSINIIGNFVGTLESIIRDLMYTLEALIDKNKEAK
ncbi:MAG: 50S ribosomal protein L10 [candidate division WOR-3 bacterium]|nr:MAG: 50S ribosomal protein L10 [candidate division WOR-3 bacterium]